MWPKVLILRPTNKSGEPCNQLNIHTRIFLSSIVLGEEIAPELLTSGLIFLLGAQAKTSLFTSLKGIPDLKDEERSVSSILTT